MRLTDSYSLFLWAALAFVPLMPSSSSLWVDEAQTWRYARHATFAEWRTEMAGDKYSESQMPLGMFFAWTWAQLIGTSEWSLRAPNMLWATGAILIFAALGRALRLPFLPLLLAIQPFLWFYANEARPYTLQIFSGSILLYGLYRGIQHELQGTAWAWIVGVGALLACGSSMLGFFSTLPALALLFFWIHREKWPVQKTQLAIGMGFTAVLLPLGAYYVSKILQGAGGAKLWQVGIGNLAFSFVEFLGFTGLLPSRQLLRTLAQQGAPLFSAWLCHPSRVVPAVFLILFFLGMGLWLIRSWGQVSVWCRTCCFYLVISFASLGWVAAMVHFPFWGRHLAASFPAYVCLLGFFINALLAQGLGKKAVVLAVFVCLTTSSLFLRFLPDHAKDDYRGVADYLVRHRKDAEVIWWAADSVAADYYGLKNYTWVMNFSAEALSRLAQPSLVALSKPDVYDSQGAIQDWLASHSFKRVAAFQAFTIWAAPSAGGLGPTPPF
jgi:hypothetical protein